MDACAGLDTSPSTPLPPRSPVGLLETSRWPTATSSSGLWGVGGVEERTPPQPPQNEPRWHELCGCGTVRDAGHPPGCGAGDGGRWPRQGNSRIGVAHYPLGHAALDDGGAAAPPLPR